MKLLARNLMLVFGDCEFLINSEDDRGDTSFRVVNPVVRTSAQSFTTIVCWAISH